MNTLIKFMDIYVKCEFMFYINLFESCFISFKQKIRCLEGDEIVFIWDNLSFFRFPQCYDIKKKRNGIVCDAIHKETLTVYLLLECANKWQCYWKQH